MTHFLLIVVDSTVSTTNGIPEESAVDYFHNAGIVPDRIMNKVPIDFGKDYHGYYSGAATSGSGFTTSYHGGRLYGNGDIDSTLEPPPQQEDAASVPYTLRKLIRIFIPIWMSL